MNFIHFKPAAKPLPTRNLKYSYKKDLSVEHAVTYLWKNYHTFREVTEHYECYWFAMTSECENETLQGNALWKHFERTLENSIYRSPWIEIRNAYVRQKLAMTKESFRFAMRQYIEVLFKEDVKIRLLEELRHAERPKNMMVQTFKQLLEAANKTVDLLPGPQTPLSDIDLKTAFFQAMEDNWRNNWVLHKGHNSLEGVQLGEIASFMNAQYTMEQDAKFKESVSPKKPQSEKSNAKQGQKQGKKEKRTAKHKERNNDSPPTLEKSFSKAYFWGHDQDSNEVCQKHLETNPQTSHTWADCNKNPKKAQALVKRLSSNTSDNNRSNKKAKYTPKKPPQASVAEVDHEEPHETNVSETHFNDSLSDKIRAINDSYMDLDIHSPVDDSLVKDNDDEDDDLNLDKIQGMFTTFAGSELLSDPDSSLANGPFMSYSDTNQMDPQMKVNEEGVPITFSTLCDTMFSIGDPDINLTPNSSINYISDHVRPTTIMSCKLIQKKQNDRPLRVLFDSGSDKTLINRRALPKGAQPTTVHGYKILGIHGTEVHRHEILLEEIMFPEFSTNVRVAGPVRATVYNNDESDYDIIVGNDLLTALKIDICASILSIKWLDFIIPFHPYDYFTSSAFSASFASASDDPFADREELAHELGYKSRDILPAKYEEVDPFVVAKNQKHLTALQQSQLADVFKKFTKLFSGKLGCYTKKKFTIDIDPNAKPFNCRPYPVSRAHRPTFKEELDHLVQIGVLSPFGASQWLAPSFIIPKKDGRVRWISDFRQLNKVIRRRVYNLPKISEILSRRAGYFCMSKIDVSMHFYTFELDEASKNLCVITTPFGNYRYNRLPMGVSQSPDIAQEVMETLFSKLDEVDNYIDDVGVFSNSWEEHLASLEKVLTILQDNNFTVNPTKCEWAVQETDWLGHWLTPKGLKPWRKKIDAILALKMPKTHTQLRSFLGAVNFYRDMYPRRSHILTPLTAVSGRTGKIKWTDEMIKSFETMKRLLAQDAFLRYPDHNKPFSIYTDASDHQMGAAIFQEGVPVAYFSKKLNAAQRNYSVGEKELLSIVETLKEFHTMLYGCQNIHVFTDHSNNVLTNLTTQRIARWRLFLEEYGVQLEYIKGKDNALADALSRLDFDESKKGSDPIDPEEAQAFFAMALDDDKLFNCFVNLPSPDAVPFVLDYRTIREAQNGDARLKLLREKHPESFADQMLAHDLFVTCYLPKNNKPWKIYLPDEILHPAVQWYHTVLGHLGQSRLYDTMSIHLYNPSLRTKIDDFVSKCDACQKNKQLTRGFGHTASREASAHPWREVHVDLIGPWELTVQGKSTTFSALTMIDPVTQLVELVRIENKQSDHIAMLFENTWLSRYPKPQSCTYDQGGEFIGNGFQRLLEHHGIHRSPAGKQTPTANSICERMHQTVGNTLRTLEYLHTVDSMTTAHKMVDTALANCTFAIRAALHSGLKATPGSLVFGRDMILDLPVVADWINIQEHRQQLIDKRRITANRKRFAYDYRVGDEVLKITYNPKKLENRAFGPFKIETVHTNGTITIRRGPHILERITIRNVKPYHR